MGRPPKTHSPDGLEKHYMQSKIKEFKQKSNLSWDEIGKNYKIKYGPSSFEKLLGTAASLDSVYSVYRSIFGYGGTITETANPRSGGYSRAEYIDLEATYAMIRPSLHEDDVIYAYRCKIKWSDDRKNHYLKIYHEKSIFSRGDISFIKDMQSIAIHFREKHNHSLIMLRAFLGDNDLPGVVTSIFPISEKDFVPASAPTALIREKDKLKIGDGYIKKGHDLYESCLSIIRNVEHKEVYLRGWWLN